MTMNKHVPFIWRVNYRNEPRSPETVLEIAHEKARLFAEIPKATRMTMARFHVVAICEKQADDQKTLRAKKLAISL